MNEITTTVSCAEEADVATLRNRVHEAVMAAVEEVEDELLGNLSVHTEPPRQPENGASSRPPLWTIALLHGEGQGLGVEIMGQHAGDFDLGVRLAMLAFQTSPATGMVVMAGNRETEERCRRG